MTDRTRETMPPADTIAPAEEPTREQRRRAAWDRAFELASEAGVVIVGPHAVPPDPLYSERE